MSGSGDAKLFARVGLEVFDRDAALSLDHCCSSKIKSQPISFEPKYEDTL